MKDKKLPSWHQEGKKTTTAEDDLNAYLPPLLAPRDMELPFAVPVVAAEPAAPPVFFAPAAGPGGGNLWRGAPSS